MNVPVHDLAKDHADLMTAMRLAFLSKEKSVELIERRRKLLRSHLGIKEAANSDNGRSQEGDSPVAPGT